MIATYRLSHSKWATTFDFYYWMVMVQARGATEIVFDIRDPKPAKFGQAGVMERFHSILEPGPELAGLKSRIGTDLSQVDTAGIISVHHWIRAGHCFKRLKTVKPAVQCDYTVTLRRYASGPKLRQSNVEAWSRFAEHIGAILIDDYSYKPIHIHDRMALYAGAKMNFGVCNGPFAPLSLSEYPLMMFINDWSARADQIRNGYSEGEKFPWMLDNQHMVWQEDTFDNLRRAFDQWATATISSQQVSHAG